MGILSEYADHRAAEPTRALIQITVRARLIPAVAEMPPFVTVNAAAVYLVDGIFWELIK